jgi:hypothetical protein
VNCRIAELTYSTALNDDRHPELPTGVTDPPRMKVCSPFRGWVGILFSLSYEAPARLRGPRRMTAASRMCGDPSRLASLAPQGDV